VYGVYQLSTTQEDGKIALLWKTLDLAVRASLHGWQFLYVGDIRVHISVTSPLMNGRAHVGFFSNKKHSATSKLLVHHQWHIYIYASGAVKAEKTACLAEFTSPKSWCRSTSWCAPPTTTTPTSSSRHSPSSCWDSVSPARLNLVTPVRSSISIGFV
jgi:hypothetical protein